jgi:hypothetical protein
LQKIVEQLTIHVPQDIELVNLQPPELCLQVTGHGRSAEIQVDGYKLHIDGFITPGQWYKDAEGKWLRRYGGQYEVMDLRIKIPTGDNILRVYGTYNRQVVDGQFQWVRIDEFSDFLEIDKTQIQIIRPLCN